MKLDLSFIWTAFVQLLSVIPTTLQITFVSTLFGFVIGTATAIFRMYKVPVLHQISASYVTFIRGTPVLTHLMLIYIGLPVIIDGLSEHYGWGFRSASIPMIGFAYVSLSITAGAYISEVVRSGLLAVNRGQMEAAHSIGMTTWQAMRRIVIPQAFALNLSNISNMVIGMLHGSSLAFIVSVVDISAKAKIVASSNWKFFEANLAAALIYWGLVILIERGTLLLEKRIHAFNHGGVA